jgi:predicted O-methyltransferase YrrM
VSLVSATTAGSFAAAWASMTEVEGWLTEAQARRLFERAGAVPADGQVVEIGSFRGRSAIVLALGAPAGAQIVAVDPHLGSDRGPQEIAADHDLGEEDVRTFQANLERAGVLDRVRHVRRRSQDALDEAPPAIDLLFVDGAHRYGPARDDVVAWGARVAPGGRMLVHDAFSSVGVTLALLRHVTFAGRWRYAGRDGSLAEYVHARRTARSVLSQLALIPYFARNLVVKALIVAGLRRAARALGHREGPWPF